MPTSVTADKDGAVARKALIRKYEVIVEKTKHADDKAFRTEWLRHQAKIREVKAKLQGKQRHLEETLTPQSEASKAAAASAIRLLVESKNAVSADLACKRWSITDFVDSSPDCQVREVRDMLTCCLVEREAKAARHDIECELRVTRLERDKLEAELDAPCRELDALLRLFGRRQEAVLAGETDLPTIDDLPSASMAGSSRSSRSSRSSHSSWDDKRHVQTSPPRRSRSPSPDSRRSRSPHRSSRRSRRSRSRSRSPSPDSRRSSRRSSGSGGSRRRSKRIERSNTMDEVKSKSKRVIESVCREWDVQMNKSIGSYKMNEDQWQAIDQQRVRYNLSVADFAEVLARKNWSIDQWQSRFRQLCYRCREPLKTSGTREAGRLGATVKPFFSVCGSCAKERYQGFASSTRY